MKKAGGRIKEGGKKEQKEKEDKKEEIFSYTI